MNRGERRQQERAIANGRLLPEEKERIRDQQELPADQPLPKTDPEPIPPKVRLFAQSAGELYITLRERQRIRDQQELPSDHTSEITRDPRYTMAHQARPVLNAIARSGLVPVLEKRLRHHPGRPSRISITSLLLCMILNAELNETYLRTDICSAFNGLDPQIGFELGLWDRDGFTPITYTMVAKQLKRLERALDETWQSIDGTFHTLDWFAHTWLKATIPRQLRKACTSMSIDWSPVETYAVTKDHTPEKIARQQPHRKYEEPSDTPAIGEFGPNKRVHRSADLHATAGHRSATNKRKAGKFVGYDAFIGTLAPDYHWKGDINHISIKETPPPFITHIALEPAGTHPGPVGLNAVLRSKETLPNLKQVIADSGLTEKRETFNRPLHQLRIDVVKQYHTKVPKPDPIKAGRHQQKLIAYAGMFLAHWTPQHLQTKPPDATEQALAEQSAKASKFRWIVNAVLPDGSLQGECPQCAGRASTNAKTWALRNHPHKPRPELPVSALIDDEYCCKGMVTVKVEDLDTYQRIPWGTPAWFMRYRNRNQIENVNGMLKSRGGLKDGWCQVLNKTGYNLGALTLAVAHNLREQKRYRHRQQQKTACQRQPTNTDPVPDEQPILTQATRGPP